MPILSLDEEIAPEKMAPKSLKSGVRSGNTFRSPGAPYVRRYLRRGVVLSNTTGNPTVPKEMTDLGIKPDKVLYSLNKKGRWNIASYIRNIIDDGQTDYSDGTRVEVVERHNLMRGEGACLSLYSNHVSERRQVPASGTYLHYRAVPVQRTKKVPAPKPSPRRKATVSSSVTFGNTVTVLQGQVDWMDDDVDVPNTTTPTPLVSVPIPEVMYDVVYPCSATSYLAHCESHIGNHPKYTLCTRRWLRGENTTQLRLDDKFKREMRDRWRHLVDKERPAEDSCELEEEDVDAGVYDCDGNEVATRDYVLGEVLAWRSKGAEVRGSRRRGKASRRRTEGKVKDGSHVRLLPEERQGQVESLDDFELPETPAPETPVPESPVFQTSPVSSSPDLLPVTVLLPDAETTCDALRERYGAQYTEVDCSPRKFLLDISQRARQALRSSTTLSQHVVGQLEATAFLVFAQLGGTSDPNCDGRPFQVRLNMALRMRSFRIETLFDWQPLSLEDVVEKTLSYLTMIPVECFVKKAQTKPLVEVSPGKSLLKDHLNVEARRPYEGLLAAALAKSRDCQSPGTCCTFDEESEDGDVDVGYVSFASDGASEEDSRSPVCDVCFEELGSPSSLGPSGTSSPCGHWFCDRCWGEHLTSKVKDGSLTLTCPAFDCDVTVDAATALTLIGVERVEAHLRHVMDAGVVRGNGKWCPNPECGRVLVANLAATARASGPDEEADATGVALPTSTCLDASCLCGWQVCLACQTPAHWPASCSQAAAYRRKLHDTGDEEESMGMDFEHAASTAQIRGKLCPSCNRFMMKNGGCKAIVCLCGKSFCWACLGPAYHDYKFNPKCFQVGDEDRTILLGVKHVDRKITDAHALGSLYLRALHHRLRHGEDVQRHFHMQNQNLAADLLRVGSSAKPKVKELLGFTERDSWASAGRTLSSRLNQLAAQFRELHRIIEYTYVRMEASSHATSPSRASLRNHCQSLNKLCAAMETLLRGRPAPDIHSFIVRTERLCKTMRKGVVLLGKMLKEKV